MFTEFQSCKYELIIVFMNVLFAPGISCILPEPMENAHVEISGTDLGDTANYTCYPGRAFPNGNRRWAVRTCADLAEWTNIQGKCESRVTFCFSSHCSTVQGKFFFSCCRSRSDKDCLHHLTVALHLSLCCESDVHESIFMSLIFRFLLMVSLNRRRGRPLFL